MSVSNCCVWERHAGEGDVLTIANAQCMDSTPLCRFKLQRHSLTFPRTRSPCYSAWGLSERMSIRMSMWMIKHLWGVRTLTTRCKHTTKTMHILVYHEFTFVTQTPNPFVHQCPMSKYASTSYQPYNGNERCCVQQDVQKARVFRPCRNRTSPYQRHHQPYAAWWPGHWPRQVSCQVHLPFRRGRYR